MDYNYFSQKWRRSTKSAKTRPGADCGSDHELLIEKFRLKLKKGGKIIRPFRYDLNKTPYNYTVEVTNRFKGFNLIDRVTENLWTEDWTGGSAQNHPQEEEMQQGKMVVWGGLTKTCDKNRSKRQKRKDIHLNAKVQRTARRDKKAFLSKNCKK